MDIPHETLAALIRPLFWVAVLGAIVWMARFLPERWRALMFKRLW